LVTGTESVVKMSVRNFEPPSLAATEALIILLNHENVKFEIGHGPNGKVVIVDELDITKIKNKLQQWRSALARLNLYLQEH
jgi:hypothetical protein